MNIILLYCVLIPLLGSFLLPAVAKKSTQLRNYLALLLVFCPFICSCILLPAVIFGGHPFIQYEFPLGLTMGLYADCLSVGMGVTSTLVACAIIIYSWSYMKEYDHQNEFYMLAVLFIGSMMGIVYATNLIMIYGCWEISSVCCWRLVGFYREEDMVKKGEKAFLITVAGALVMLVGFIGIYAQTGTFCLTEMKGVVLPDWIVYLILFGILSKSATFPLHSWLPDAGVAPSPVTSLLHAAVLVKIGVYAYARFFDFTFTIDNKFNVIVPAIAGVSALITAGCALAATDLKRVIAYSTVSQLAFILLGMSAGNSLALEGGMMYIMVHSIGKGGLFLCAGIVEHNLHTKDLNKMGGLIKTMPWTAAAFLLNAFSIMGIPPFGGFFAKFLVIDGAFSSGETAIGIVFTIGAVMTLLYLLRLFKLVFLGPQKCPEVHEGSRSMIATVFVMGIISLLLGVFVCAPAALILASM